jgi:hypothetical protein
VIAQDRQPVLEAGLEALSAFGRPVSVRGRFVALYLGLRRMHDAVAPLGSEDSTPASEIERFLDEMFSKTQRPEPLVVLTAPFGSNASNGGYSTRSGEIAEGHRYPTNTWRNNFGIQKGIGCPAEAEVVDMILHDPARRLSCPHMRQDPDGQYVCSIENSTYRGEEHSVWLRRTGGGYQVVDLDLPGVYEPYLNPARKRIPLFALIGVLYSFAPATVYPAREIVGIPDFADDFHFSREQVETIFDVDPESDGNAPVLQAAQVEAEPLPAQVSAPAPRTGPASPPRRRARLHRSSGTLPPEADPVEMNTGLGAERLVAEQLIEYKWSVQYRGNERRLGYDLEAERTSQSLYVEVKSSVSFTEPELTDSEWMAAQQHGESYILAVVDFYGSEQQSVWYVRDPASGATTSERTVSVFRLQRASVEPLGTEAEFL